MSHVEGKYLLTLAQPPPSRQPGEVSFHLLIPQGEQEGIQQGHLCGAKLSSHAAHRVLGSCPQVLETPGT